MKNIEKKSKELRRKFEWNHKKSKRDTKKRVDDKNESYFNRDKSSPQYKQRKCVLKAVLEEELIGSLPDESILHPGVSRIQITFEVQIGGIHKELEIQK